MMVAMVGTSPFRIWKSGDMARQQRERDSSISFLLVVLRNKSWRQWFKPLSEVTYLSSPAGWVSDEAITVLLSTLARKPIHCPHPPCTCVIPHSFSQRVFFRDLPRPGTVLDTRKRAEEKTQKVWVGGRVERADDGEANGKWPAENWRGVEWQRVGGRGQVWSPWEGDI